MYTLTYVGWIVVWVIPAVIVGIVTKGISGFFAGPNNWCYFNNPWETWAYAVQGAARTSIDGVDDKDRKMIWPAKYVIAWSIPFFALATLLAILAVISVWNGDEPPQNKTNSSAHRPRAQLSAPGHSLHDASSLDRFLVAAPGSDSPKESLSAVSAIIPPHGSSRLVSSVALPRSNVSNWRIRHG